VFNHLPLGMVLSLVALVLIGSFFITSADSATFVGVFIARVSKGRSIREFISGVLLVPALVSFLWFSVFGVLGIETGKKHSELFKMSAETQLFGVFNHLPLGMVLSLVALVLIGSFFITSADSATFV
ncbi:hypothetical protein BUE67_14140, partial [Corynebacterium diphtheriae]